MTLQWCLWPLNTKVVQGCFKVMVTGVNTETIGHNEICLSVETLELTDLFYGYFQVLVYGQCCFEPQTWRISMITINS